MILNKLHIHRLSVEFDLLDAGNVVYHPNYLILCERARNAALSEAGYTFKEMWSAGNALAIVESNSKYMRAIEYGQDLAILTLATDSTGTRLTVHQDIVLASSLPLDFQSPGYKSVRIEAPKKDIFYQVDFTLASVKLNPIKPSRHPEGLSKALGLSTRTEATGSERT